MRDDRDYSQTTSSAGAVEPIGAWAHEVERPAAGSAEPWFGTAVSRVSVLGADRELAAAVPAIDRPRAQRAMWMASLSFEAGRVELAATARSPAVFALLVIQGVLTRDTGLGDRGIIEFMLAGDVLSPWPGPVTASMTQSALTALDNVRLAVLDHAFLKAAAVWPSLMVTVQRRLADQQHRLATHGAICQLPRVEQRVLAIMWLLADRMGTVTTHGTELPFALTHDALARLTGSRRPTVSLAVKRLRESGHLERRDNGAWLLPSLPAGIILEELLASLTEI